MFPNPVYSLRGFVAKITAVEITTKEKYELNLWSIGSAQLRNLHGFLFPSLVRIRKVAGGLRLNQERKSPGLGLFRHYHRINWNVDLFDAVFKLNRNVHSK